MSYIFCICQNNHENDLFAAIADINIEKNYIHKGYIYSDISDRRQNPTLQLLLTITNIKNIDLSSNSISLLIIFYCSKAGLFH